MPGANAGGARGCEKARNVDIGQPTHSRHARVNRVALATGEPTTIGGDVAVVDVGGDADAGVANPEFVHQAGTGGPNPVDDDVRRAYQSLQVKNWVHEAVIVSIAEVVADPKHAAEPML